MCIRDSVDDDGEETGGLFTARTAGIAAIVLAVALLGLIVAFMPPKIKKIE